MLFPFDRSDGLRREIHQNAVDALNLMGDAVGDVVQQRVGDLLDGGGHGVLGVDGADDGRPALVAALVLHADALDVGHGDEVLPDLLVQAVLLELFAQDGVSLAQRLQTVAGDGAEAADAEARARERLTIDHAVRQAEGLADHADLVLEEELEGLDQLELQILRQTADVVMGLDSLLSLGSLDGLEDVGVDRALREEGNAFQLAGFVRKDGDEFLADDLALALRLRDAGQQTQEMIGGVHIDQVGVKTFLEHLDDALGLVLAHEAVVDMHADQLLADGLDQQRRDDGAVHAAGESQQHLLVANLRTDGGNLLVDERIGQFRRGDARHGFGTDIAHDDHS